MDHTNVFDLLDESDSENEAPTILVPKAVGTAIAGFVKRQEDADEVDDFLTEEEEKLGEIDLENPVEIAAVKTAPAEAGETEAVAQWLQQEREQILGEDEALDKCEMGQEISSELTLENAISILRKNKQGQLRQGYAIIQALLDDPETSYSDKVMGATYLVQSERREYLSHVREFLEEMIANEEFLSSDKYGAIIKFYKSCPMGLCRSVTQEWFDGVLGDTQWAFFNDPHHDMTNRLLSGQFMLAGQCYAALERKRHINETMGCWLIDPEISNNVKADCADILLRVGDKTRKLLALEVINDIGFEDGGYTVFDNSQNAHNKEITDSVYKFIEEELVKDRIPTMYYEVKRTSSEGKVSATKYRRIQTLIDVVQELREAAVELNIEVNTAKLNESVERIDRDVTSFTGCQMRLGEILQRVWNRIKHKKPEDRLELVNRLMEELVDSAGTCSSGHVVRLINVLCGYGVLISISWKEQIIANIKGRAGALIRESPAQIKEVIALWTDSTVDEQMTVSNYLSSLRFQIYQEMEGEFVGEQLVESSEFNAHFDDGWEKLYHFYCPDRIKLE